MAGWYELNTNDKGQYSFVLKAANAEIIMRSEQYESRDAAQNGIASVQRNSPNDANYERKDASDGRTYWECQKFCVRGALRLVHGGGRRLRRTTDAVGKSVPHITRQPS